MNKHIIKRRDLIPDLIITLFVVAVVLIYAWLKGYQL